MLDILLCLMGALKSETAACRLSHGSVCVVLGPFVSCWVRLCRVGMALGWPWDGLGMDLGWTWDLGWAWDHLRMALGWDLSTSWPWDGLGLGTLH